MSASIAQCCVRCDADPAHRGPHEYPDGHPLKEHTPHLTIAGNHCEVHGSHRPTPVRTVKHHIHPQEYGGPTVPGNLVLVCDTGHYNIHACLDALLRGTEMPKAARREKAYALRGYLSIKKGQS